MEAKRKQTMLEKLKMVVLDFLALFSILIYIVLSSSSSLTEYILFFQFEMIFDMVTKNKREKETKAIEKYTKILKQ